jgi:hypothetical protein
VFKVKVPDSDKRILSGITNCKKVEFELKPTEIMS